MSRHHPSLPLTFSGMKKSRSAVLRPPTWHFTKEPCICKYLAVNFYHEDVRSRVPIPNPAFWEHGAHHAPRSYPRSSTTFWLPGVGSTYCQILNITRRLYCNAANSKLLKLACIYIYILYHVLALRLSTQ